MERILEAELMDDEEQARAYAQADFATSNQWFVDQLVADFGAELGRVVDLGCGSGDVLLRLAAARPAARITAVDGSAAMVALAGAAVAAAGLAGQIRLVQGYIPGALAGPERYDAVLSKDFLHHLPDPLVLWREVRRLGRPGAAVCIMDLIRPAGQAEARAIVERVAGGEAPILKEDFFNSLCAAFRPAEVEDQLRSCGLGLAVRQVSERHMLITGWL